MGVFGRVRAAARAFWGVPVPQMLAARSADELNGVRTFWGGSGDPPARDASGLLEAFSNNPWLRAVFGRVMDAVAAIPWHVSAVRMEDRYVRVPGLSTMSQLRRHERLDALREAGTLDIFEEHPLEYLLSGGNTLLVGSTLRGLTVLSFDLTGEAFWWLERNAVGAPVQAWPIPPHWIASTPTRDSPYYRISYGTFHDRVPARDVLRFHQPNPLNPYGRGSGVAMSLTDEVDIDEYSARHEKAFFYNSAMPPAVVMPGKGDPSLNPTQTGGLEQRWLAQTQGFFRRFVPFFVPRYMEIKELGQSFRDMELAELRRHQRDVIQQTVGIPPEKMGVINNSNRSTIGAADYLFAKDTLIPRLELMRQTIVKHLLPQYGDPRLMVDYENPINKDNEFHLQVAQAFPAATSFDEQRAMMGLPPIKNGHLHLVTNRATIGKIEPGERPARKTKPPQAPLPKRAVSG